MDAVVGLAYGIDMELSPESSFKIYVRGCDAKKGLNKDQTIAIAGIFASFFGASCVYFLFARVKRWLRRRRLQGNAGGNDIEIGAVQVPSHVEPVSLVSPLEERVATPSLPTQHPPLPAAQPDTDSAVSPHIRRTEGLGLPSLPERVLTWPSHERPR